MTPLDEHLNQDTGPTGDTRLLDGDDEADGRWSRLHLWPHLQDACIYPHSMVDVLGSVTFAPSSF